MYCITNTLQIQLLQSSTWILDFCCKSKSRIANVRSSLCLSISLSQKPLSLSESCLSAKSQPIWANIQLAIMPISHHATQPLWTPLDCTCNAVLKLTILLLPSMEKAIVAFTDFHYIHNFQANLDLPSSAVKCERYLEG